MNNNNKGLPWQLSSEEFPCQCKRPGFDPWVGKIPWRRAWQPAPASLPGECHGQRSLVGLPSTWSQRVGHNSATKQQQKEIKGKECDVCIKELKRW